MQIHILLMDLWPALRWGALSAKPMAALVSVKLEGHMGGCSTVAWSLELGFQGDPHAYPLWPSCPAGLLRIPHFRKQIVHMPHSSESHPCHGPSYTDWAMGSLKFFVPRWPCYLASGTYRLESSEEGKPGCRMRKFRRVVGLVESWRKNPIWEGWEGHGGYRIYYMLFIPSFPEWPHW